MSEILEAVESTPVDTAVDSPEVTEVEQEVSDGSESSGDQSSPEVSADSDGAESDEVRAESRGKQGRMPAHLSAHLAEIQETNPQLYKDIKQLYFANQSYKQLFPKIEEAKRLKQIFEHAGGESGLQSLQQDIAFYNQLDQKWMNGDPSLVDGFAQSNPQTYVKLMPTFMERFAQLDQEAYGRTQARVMINTLTNAGVANALYLAQQQLKQNPEEAGRLLGEVQNWMQGMDNLASSQPRRPQQDPLQQERINIQREKEQLYRHSISSEVGFHRANAIRQELGNYLNGKQLSQPQMEVLEERVVRELQTVLSSDQGFNSNLNKYYSARDRDGVLKLLKSRIDTAIPDAVKKVYGVLFSGNAPKTVKKAQAEPNKAGKPAAKPVQTGWVKVTKRPSISQIDYSKSPMEMIGRSRAVLKDGRKVSWEN